MSQHSRSITVRPFELTDAEAVLALIQDLAAFHDDQASASAADLVRYAGGHERISSVTVALMDGVVCGFSSIYEWMNDIHGFPVRNIDLFFVRESARGSGVGRALLESIARDAQRSACRRITVGAEPGNEGANAFYRRMGFELRHSAANRYAISGDALDQLAVA